MGRVFRTETGARRRQRLMRSIASVLRLAAEHNPDEADQKDLLAYVGLALVEIVESVDQSASAWEKRGYWVKSDRFREEWRWAVDALAATRSALKEADEADMLAVFTSLLDPLNGVDPYKRVQDQPTWQGALQVWRSSGKD